MHLRYVEAPSSLLRLQVSRAFGFLDGRDGAERERERERRSYSLSELRANVRTVDDKGIAAHLSTV